MILTTKARYAVMAVIEIASQPDNKPINLMHISKNQNISLSYLEQIFVHLKKYQIVNSHRGPGGGYVLAKNKSEINVADIIKAIEEPIKMTRCSTEIKGCMTNKTKCKTHHLWQGLEHKIYDYLNSITIDKI